MRPLCGAIIVAGAVIGLVAKSKYDSGLSHCVGTICDAEGKQATDDARSLGNVATVVFGVGAVVAAGGIVLWLTAPRGAPAARTALRVGARSVWLEGSF